MTLILSNALVNTMHFSCIYMDDGNLVLEGTTTVVISGVPSDALAKIAVAASEERSYVEFENGILELEATDEN